MAALLYGAGGGVVLAASRAASGIREITGDGKQTSPDVVRALGAKTGLPLSGLQLLCLSRRPAPTNCKDMNGYKCSIRSARHGQPTSPWNPLDNACRLC